MRVKIVAMASIVVMPERSRSVGLASYGVVVADDDGNTTVLGSRVLTVPNAISMLRLLGLPVFLWLLFANDDRVGAAYLLAVLGASDWVDGYIARRFNQTSELGKLLDPVADRLLFLVGVGAIVVDESAPLWVGLLLLVREALVSLVAIVIGIFGARRIDVTWLGKTSSFLLMVAFPLFLVANSMESWREIASALAWMAVVPGLVLHWMSAGTYVPAARLALREGRAGRRSGST